MKKYTVFLSIFLVYVIACMAAKPNVFIAASLDGIKAWAFNVLPSVLPFIFFCKALSSLGDVEKVSNVFARPFSKAFNCPPSASFVFLMSIISGYPVGAKMMADLFESGKISRSQAYRMTAFCSTSGPMFVIGAVGAGMLLSSAAGYIIFVSHILGALANGLLYRHLKVKNDEILRPADLAEHKQSLGEIVTDSALSILCVGTIIAVFFVIIQSLSPLLSLLPESVRPIAAGLIEITHGCLDISAVLPLRLATLACTFVISFGGLSTILQSQAMLNRLKMPIKLFVLQKLTHAIFATLFSCLFVLFL